MSRQSPASLLARYDITAGETAVCALMGGVVALVLALEMRVAIPVALLTGYFAATMLLVAVIDLRRLIIPDALSLPAIPLGLLTGAMAQPEDWPDVVWDHLAAALAAAIVLLALRWAYFHSRGVVGLGLGDVKLGAAAGAWVGLSCLPVTSLIATGGALAAVVLHRLIRKEEVVESTAAIPFGSFIALATAMVWLALLLTA